MGVWIETGQNISKFASSSVTPFVGVWIETLKISALRSATAVTPFVGVWIETVCTVCLTQNNLSHTLRGCVD